MANKNNKYKVYRKYTTDDNGISWVETDEYRIVLVEENSKDCITETPTNTRWVETTGYICANKNKYAKEIKQISTDGGKTWTDTGEYRQGKLIEENSKDCGYTEVQYRWVVINDNSRYVCVGTEKHKMEIRQLSNDGGITWVNVSPEETRASDEIIERNSLDCGGTAIYYKWVDTGFECGSNIPTGSKIVTEAPGELTKETVYRWVVAQGDKDYICDGKVKYYLYVRQQSTDGGLTWSDVQPRETQKGAVINNNSVDCSCGTKVTYTDGTTGSYTGHLWLDRDDIKNFKSESAITLDIGTCITGIRSGGFSGCTNLQKIFIPYSVSEIGSAAFSHCTSLQSIEIPNNVIKLSYRVFLGCTGLMEVKIGNGINGINPGVFEDCISLSSITLGDNIKFIGSGAFENCSSLQKINIPSGVTKIYENTFENCSSLQKINIPSGVTEILENAFQNCKTLSSVTINNSSEKIKYNSGAFFEISSTAKLYVPSNLVSDYKEDSAWRYFFGGGIYPIS